MPKPYVNFEAALLKLIEFNKNFDQSEIQRTAIIKAFELTFEQSWKALQKIAGTEGVMVASPKKAFQWAIQAGHISATEEPIWISMLDERNNAVHAYREAIAIKVLSNIQQHFISAFANLLNRLKAN